MTIHITIFLDQQHRDLLAAPGKTLLEILQEYNIQEIEGACDGSMACSTCHVILDQDWYKRLPAASDDEKDILELANGLTPTSRLACQILLTADMDGLVIKSPHNRSVS